MAKKFFQNHYFHHCAITLLLFSLAGTINGCAFFDLKKDLKEYEANFGLTGKITRQDDKENPIVVVLYRHEQKGLAVSQYMILTEDSRNFSFIVQEGIYYIAAFTDLNRNLCRDKGETFGYFGKPEAIRIDQREMAMADIKAKKDLDIKLNQENGFPPTMPTSVCTGNLVAESFVKLGLITDLDDKIFAQENGYLGYWKPFSFIKKFGVGIYFLEKYNPDKIPVLFVHGANGTPVGWKPIVARLDQRRYQPWFFYYPSGLRLNSTAKTLNFLVHKLHDEYEFTTMHVITHSMGGLVSRAFIIKNVVEDKQNYIKKFISISTPWGGVSTAALGVKKAPAVIPNWHDISPDSDFIQYIYRDHLAPQVKFYLFFGVKGKCSMMMANNDGTVEIASEIDYRAQADSAGFYGFDEDHDTVLTSERVGDKIVDLLIEE